MIKKIVHLSDIHVKTLKEHDNYRNIFNNFIEELKINLLEYDKSEIRIVITGDIVHQKINISNEQILLITEFFRKLTKIGKLIILPGNHDFLVNNFERVDSLTPIVEFLDDENIVYFKDYGQYQDENIDWIVYSLYQFNHRPEFTKTNERKAIGLFHGQIQGLSTDLGFTFEEAYSPLNFNDCDLVLCGDIHKRQTFKLSTGGKGVMIGSFIQQDFGESVKHHGYGIYDVETDEYNFHDLKNDEPFLHFLIKDISDIDEGNEILLNLE